MNIINEIKEYWNWSGIGPVEIVAVNDFGNLIIKDHDDKFWRLCPEDVYCEIIADSVDDYDNLIGDSEFIKDWNMSVMVEDAMDRLGPLAEGDKYYMVIPGVVDGEYGGSNIKMAPLAKIIKFSGDLGRQIKDLPDGAEIKFKIMD